MMQVYLLPSSKKQSRMVLGKYTLKDFFTEESINRFRELDDKRIELLKVISCQEELLPVWRRYAGPFWNSLEFWVLPPKVQNHLAENSVVISPVFGLLSLNDWIPYCQAQWSKELRSFWRETLKGISRELLKDKVVFSFLGKEELSLIDTSSCQKLITFEFYKRERRVYRDQPHKAYTLRYIAERQLGYEHLTVINFYDYKVESIREEGKRVRVVLKGQGAYI
ncbi:peroxide stress protein YaaA [Thermocrinis minervae]|nr:peroxide stress protein YaaA [Thermocrinis minervae]